MIAYVQLVLAGIALLDKIVGLMDRDQLIASGKGLAIAEALAAVMKKVANAKQVEAAVGKLSDADIANELSEYSYDDKRG